MDYFDRQVFAGPPENTRDVIIAASKSLAKGEWKRCEELLLALPIWSLVHNSDQVKAMLRRKIQEEGLRTYLFTYSSYYDSMSLEQLSQMFELPKNSIHSIVSKMMISEELHASWDQPTGSVVMHKVEPSRLQYLSMQFAERAAQAVENNERMLDSRTGGYGYKFDAKPQKERWQDRDQRQNRPYQNRQQGQGGNRTNKDNQHNNNQYGNNQYGNNQYGNNQYGNNQYNNQQQRGGYSGQYQQRGYQGNRDGQDRKPRQPGQRRDFVK